jgi:hypothetical protein
LRESRRPRGRRPRRSSSCVLLTTGDRRQATSNSPKSLSQSVQCSHDTAVAAPGVMQAPGNAIANARFRRRRVARPPSAWRPTATPPLTSGSCGRAGEQAKQECEREPPRGVV